MLRVSFSSGRDRVHRHCWISPFRTPSGLSLLSLFLSLTPPSYSFLVVGRFGEADSYYTTIFKGNTRKKHMFHQKRHKKRKTSFFEGGLGGAESLFSGIDGFTAVKPCFWKSATREGGKNGARTGRKRGEDPERTLSPRNPPLSIGRVGRRPPEKTLRSEAKASFASRNPPLSFLGPVGPRSRPAPDPRVALARFLIFNSFRGGRPKASISNGSLGS